MVHFWRMRWRLELAQTVSCCVQNISKNYTTHHVSIPFMFDYILCLSCCSSSSSEGLHVRGFIDWYHMHLRNLFFVTKRHEKWRAPQLSGVVCAFHALSTEALGLNPKHSRYAFSWFIWLMLLLSHAFVIELWNWTEIWK